MVARLTLPDMVYGVTPKGGPDLRFILFTVTTSTGPAVPGGGTEIGVLFGAWSAAGELVPLVFGAWSGVAAEYEPLAETWSG